MHSMKIQFCDDRDKPSSLDALTWVYSMACIAMAYTVMAYIFMACTVMACICVTYRVMAR